MMGAVCAVVTGLLVAVMSAVIWADEWVDPDQRWIILSGGLVLGVGTILHAVGWW